MAFTTTFRQATAPPSFPRRLRHALLISVTVRVLWLMSALMLKHGYASMSIERMAQELDATPAAVRKARKRIVALGLFEPVGGGKYQPVFLPGENRDRAKFWQRARADPRLDLVARCVWLLSNMTRQGEVPLSTMEIAGRLATSERSAARAVAEVLTLGCFRVTEQGGGRGQRNSYARCGEAKLPAVPDHLSLFEEMFSHEDDHDDGKEIDRDRLYQLYADLEPADRRRGR
jgi:hypothetical protein